MEEKIERIEKIDKLDKKERANAIEEVYSQDASKALEPNKDHFQALMAQEKKKPAVEPAAAISQGSKPSLMDEVATFNTKVESASRSNPKNIAVQATELIAQLDELKAKLATPNLELKSSVQNLLKNRLSHIDDSLKIALNKAGVEYVPPPEQKNLSTPIERFLGYITDAQAQLQGLGGDVEKLALKKGEISPADMLAIQVKVGYIQQEVEFFTSLLNKALESTKTIMNVQV
ncbi:MAG TPA: hypothetical protein PLC42_03280 [Parachlamydiaceae bacterium]|nr:hypothetical protein [Parachlamydiaceae bacterium]